MENCPFCGSDNIYYSKKKKVFVCEDCDKVFTEADFASDKKKESSHKGLELFFSYGHDKNKFIVDRIKRDLEKRGHHVWIDYAEIKTGNNWRDGILQGILNASAVVAFLSEYSTRDPGVCLDELKIAVCVKGVNIKTVLLEPERKISQPSTISDIQWLDMSNWTEMNQSGHDFEAWYQEKFAQLTQVIESEENLELTGDIHYIKERLKPYLNTEKEYQLLSKDYFGREWLEDYIENWIEQDASKALVIYGKPGGGKSAFCVNYSHYNPNVYGCFLCEWNRKDTIEPNRLIRTIAFRIATKLPDYRALLLKKLNEGNVDIDKMPDEVLFDFLLTDILNNLVDGNRETGLIVIDALDEAQQDENNPLVNIFAKCVESLPRWVKFIYTSRREKNISAYLSNFKSVDIVKDIPEGYNDIMGYLTRKLTTKLVEIPNTIETLNHICDLSEGVFLYAEMIADDILKGAVDICEIEHFPKGLTAIYQLSFKRKFKSDDDFIRIRQLLEVLVVAETIPEELLRNACGYKQYEYLKLLDTLGSWVNREDAQGCPSLRFFHKSLKDWLTDKEKNTEFFVDKNAGGLRLARYCRAYLAQTAEENQKTAMPLLDDYIKKHVCFFYCAANAYAELQAFLLEHTRDLYPYWCSWNELPEDWDHKPLLDAFWHSPDRNEFIRILQRKGNTRLLIWIFDLAQSVYSLVEFEKEIAAVYVDMVHMAGRYADSVNIANQYLQNYTKEEIAHDKSLAELSIRKLHHSMFYKPAEELIDECMAVYAQWEDRFPKVTNELIFLIGGNLGVLAGNWEITEKWLAASIDYTNTHHLKEFEKRNARRLADYYCHAEQYDDALQLIGKYIPHDQPIVERYDAYLRGVEANAYTCLDRVDDALRCYEETLQFATAQGIVNWIAHSYLGMANINLKIGNLKEAESFASRAEKIYQNMQQEWGLIMSQAIRAACKSKMGIAPVRVLCRPCIKAAQRMQYGACRAAIDDLCSGKCNYLKIYYI